jgi:hypothetical protein
VKRRKRVINIGKLERNTQKRGAKEEEEMNRSQSRKHPQIRDGK